MAKPQRVVVNPLPKPPPIVARLAPILPRLQLLDASLGGSVSLLATAMLLYPGGTWWNRTTLHYRLTENFLCDLLHQKSLSQMPNLVGSRLATIALLLLVVAVVAFFSLASELVPSRKSVGRKVGWCGAIAALFLITVPLLPSDKHPALHSLAVVFGTFPALAAFATLVGALLLEPKAPLALRTSGVCALVAQVLCAVLYTWDVYFGGPSLMLLAGLESVALLLAVTFLFLAGRFVRARLLLAYRLVKERAERRTGL